MPRRYHRAPEFRREHAYVLLFLPACTLVTCVSLALADVYRVPGLARACTVHSCVTREGFRLRVNLQKTRVHGCAHVIRAILNASTMLASIKFKSSCTVYSIAIIKPCNRPPCLIGLLFSGQLSTLCKCGLDTMAPVERTKWMTSTWDRTLGHGCVHCVS